MVHSPIVADFIMSDEEGYKSLQVTRNCPFGDTSLFAAFDEFLESDFVREFRYTF
jgi:hypothetical protein